MYQNNIAIYFEKKIILFVVLDLWIIFLYEKQHI